MVPASCSCWFGFFSNSSHLVLCLLICLVLDFAHLLFRISFQFSPTPSLPGGQNTLEIPFLIVCRFLFLSLFSSISKNIFLCVTYIPFPLPSSREKKKLYFLYLLHGEICESENIHRAWNNPFVFKQQTLNSART